MADSSSGTAVDASNSSIIYTNRQFYNAVSVFANANTGSDGKYTLYLIPGFTYGICGSTSGTNPLNACTSVTVNSATSATITFPSQNVGYTVSGTVRLGSQAATGVAVSAGGTGTADSNGNYAINNVANGSYSVGLDNGGSVPCDHPSNVCNEGLAIDMVAENNSTNPPSNLVNVNGASVTQSFNLPATVPVSITVDNADGTPASGVALVASSGSGVAVNTSNSSIVYTNRQFYNAVSVFANTNTGSDGKYTLYLIPGYTYAVCGTTTGTNPLGGCTSLGTVSTAMSAVVTVPLPTPVSLVANSSSYYPSLSWTGANLVNGANYVIYRDGTAVGASTTPLFTDTSAPTGTHSYVVKVNANGYYGLPSNTIQVTVTVDTTPPTLGTPSWSTNSVALGNNSTLTVPVSDNQSGVSNGEYFIGTDPGVGSGTSMSLSGGNLTASIGASLTVGVYTVGVHAKDNAGNWSPVTSTMLVVYDPTSALGISGRSRNLVPSLANGDIMPGLISSNQTDVADYGMTVSYKNGAIDSHSGLKFNYSTGTNCHNNNATNCHSFSLNATSFAWLIIDSTNNSRGRF